jgi:hypothetical protein
MNDDRTDAHSTAQPAAAFNGSLIDHVARISLDVAGGREGCDGHRGHVWVTGVSTVLQRRRPTIGQRFRSPSKVRSQANRTCTDSRPGRRADNPAAARDHERGSNHFFRVWRACNNNNMVPLRPSRYRNILGLLPSSPKRIHTGTGQTMPKQGNTESAREAWQRSGGDVARRASSMGTIAVSCARINPEGRLARYAIEPAKQVCIPRSSPFAWGPIDGLEQSVRPASTRPFASLEGTRLEERRRLHRNLHRAFPKCVHSSGKLGMFRLPSG